MDRIDIANNAEENPALDWPKPIDDEVATTEDREKAGTEGAESPLYLTGSVLFTEPPSGPLPPFPFREKHAFLPTLAVVNTTLHSGGMLAQLPVNGDQPGTLSWNAHVRSAHQFYKWHIQFDFIDNHGKLIGRIPGGSPGHSWLFKVMPNANTDYWWNRTWFTLSRDVFPRIYRLDYRYEVQISVLP